MYIAIIIIPLVCLYIHECHMPITPYFFYAQKDLAQSLTNALCISIGNINIYVELDKRILNIQTLIGKTQYLPYSALLLETDAYATECMFIT